MLPLPLWSGNPSENLWSLLEPLQCESQDPPSEALPLEEPSKNPSKKRAVA